MQALSCLFRIKTESGYGMISGDEQLEGYLIFFVFNLVLIELVQS